MRYWCIIFNGYPIQMIYDILFHLNYRHSDSILGNIGRFLSGRYMLVILFENDDQSSNSP